jgi:hypothetical protein
MTPTDIAQALKAVTHTTYEEHCALVDACDHYMIRTGVNDRINRLVGGKTTVPAHVIPPHVMATFAAMKATRCNPTQ